MFAGQRLGINAALYNAYFAKRPLDLKQKKVAKVLSKIDSEFLDKRNIELSHEQLFFEDELGGNIGFFDDSKLHEESGSVLNLYAKTQEGFDDDVMREAVKNLDNRTIPYDLLGFDTCTGKYNCQDWANDVRQEYQRIKDQRSFEIWQSIINQNQ
tara:strand:- start:374 stop:838 length:465 start_codon:yes stop_codon:yes gene_type:complete